MSARLNLGDVLRADWTLVCGGVLAGTALAPLFVGTEIDPSTVGVVVSLLGVSALVVGGVYAIRRRVIWGGVVVGAILLRLPYVTLTPIHDDSLHFLTNTYEVIHAASRLSLPLSGVPLRYIGVNTVMGVFVVAFGDSGVNIASFSAAIGTVPVLGVTAATLFESRRAGIAAGVFGATLPIHVYHSSWAYSEPIALFVFSLSMYGFVAERYLLATGLTGVLSVMRAEYVLLVLLPLMALLVLRSSRAYYLAISSPFVLVGLLLAIPRLFLGTVVSITGPLSSVVVPSYVTTSGFLAAPIRHVAQNTVFYVGHFLHLGVPYWESNLVNPFILLFFVVGMYELLPSVRSSVLSLGLFSSVAAAGYAAEQVFGVTHLYGVTLLVTGGMCFAVVLLAEPRHDRRLQPLLATGPYFGLLATGFLGARYILPVALVVVLYAGYGAHRTFGQSDRLSTLTIRVPERLVRR
ncbi:hypothetical protein GJ629_02055 [Halapricum sp. CBA1109]|uniref:hypothetical protein n=1 Tax=Halapricum sp. CBA1109 TaxID=2668068 RepID=UPI0012FB6408|nr:hypothetical protein [Halapricum sp. CBA1109]MUV88822.1 hypothetical protein [Halapricum sp. CBA1109]